jgi:hypothetical protein
MEGDVMNEPEIQENKIPDISSYDDLSFDALIKFNLVSAIFNASNPEKFSFMIKSLESLMEDELKDEYFTEIKNREAELLEQNGSRNTKFAFELAHAKYRLLIKHVKSKIPREIETEI